jgi:ligand-binding sensor domain-containing protein
MEMESYVIMENYLKKYHSCNKSNFRVLEIVEDKEGNVWFGTSEGL